LVHALQDRNRLSVKGKGYGSGELGGRGTGVKGGGGTNEEWKTVERRKVEWKRRKDSWVAGNGREEEEGRKEWKGRERGMTESRITL
jgi:hypothetical protein